MSDNDFTPSTEQIRATYIFADGDQWSAERKESFDRWFADVQADIWREGAQSAYDSFETTGIGYKFRRISNPYRRS